MSPAKGAYQEKKRREASHVSFVSAGLYQRNNGSATVPQSPFSRREMRAINSGRQEIEARLDLHGLDQAAAHSALGRFLRQCHQQDLRHVLVITGKGRPSRFDAVMGEAEQGVLRRLVPLWLDEAGLCELVVGFSVAPRRHGGEGALYVRLRRHRG